MSSPAHFARTGDQLREVRRACGASQERFALELGLAARTVSSYESRGPAEIPRVIAWAARGVLAPLRSRVKLEQRRADQHARRLALRRAKQRRLEELKGERRERQAQRRALRETLAICDRAVTERSRPEDAQRLAELDEVLHGR